jgi:hypothetical protein
VIAFEFGISDGSDGSGLSALFYVIPGARILSVEHYRYTRTLPNGCALSISATPTFCHLIRVLVSLIPDQSISYILTFYAVDIGILYGFHIELISWTRCRKPEPIASSGFQELLKLWFSATKGSIIAASSSFREQVEYIRSKREYAIY